MMDKRTISIYKGIIWGMLETYLAAPGCDLNGDLLSLHSENDEKDFTASKKYSTCTLNPAFIERINVTNAFSQCRDRGIISRLEYEFVKDRCAKRWVVSRKYKVPEQMIDHHFNRIMTRACEAMVPILYPKTMMIDERVGAAV